MAVGSKVEHIRNALVYLFGERGLSVARKLPSEESFPQTVRHFDKDGVQLLPLQERGILTSNGFSKARVTMQYVACSRCGYAVYQVLDVAILEEFERGLPPVSTKE